MTEPILKIECFANCRLCISDRSSTLVIKGHNEPKGLPEREWDWKAIRAILGELKIPILKQDEDYTALYEQSKK